MLDTFNAVWTALTTTNEELIKVLLIPCNFIEITITMLLSITLLKIEATKKQKILYIISFYLFTLITNFMIPNPYKVILNILISPILFYYVFKTTVLKSILSELIPMIIGSILETIFLKLYFLAFGISKEIAYSIPIYRFSSIFINYMILCSVYN